MKAKITYHGLRKYPSGSRGSPAKGVVRETVARVQIPSSAPPARCTKNRTVFFGLSDFLLAKILNFFLIRSHIPKTFMRTIVIIKVHIFANLHL